MEPWDLWDLLTRSAGHTAALTYDFLTLIEKTRTLVKVVEVYYMVITHSTDPIQSCLCALEQPVSALICVRSSLDGVAERTALGEHYQDNLWTIQKNSTITLLRGFLRGPLVLMQGPHRRPRGPVGSPLDRRVYQCNQISTVFPGSKETLSPV